MENNKIPLIVADFDKTLIPYDSFRKYCFHWIRYKPVTISFIILMRKLRIISNASFKKNITRICSSRKNSIRIDEAFSKKVYIDIDNILLKKLQKRLPKNGELVIISASPNQYMQHFEHLLGIKTFGSYFKDRVFIHLYGEAKKKFVLTQYPKSDFHYLYSVSDSKSDLHLLKEFEEYDII